MPKRSRREPTAAEIRYLLREAGKLFIIRQRRRQLKGEAADHRIRRKQLRRKWQNYRYRKGETKQQRVDYVHHMLLDRQQGICPLCQKPLDRKRDDYDVDHIKPLALGGTSRLTNLRLVHRQCHQTLNGNFYKLHGHKFHREGHNYNPRRLVRRRQWEQP